jgi:hypothetical protein
MLGNAFASKPLVHAGSNLTPAISRDADFDVLWAAWKARSAAHARRIRRRVMILAATLAVPAAILYGLWLR